MSGFLSAGGEARSREVYYPAAEVLPALLLRPFAPGTVDAAVRAVMAPAPLLCAVAAALPPPAAVALGLGQVLAVYTAVLLLHCLLPARTFDGYVVEEQEEDGGAVVRHRLCRCVFPLVYLARHRLLSDGSTGSTGGGAAGRAVGVPAERPLGPGDRRGVSACKRLSTLP